MEISKPKISVIVLVYKVEKFIERCARSLFEQTLDEIEYIFVNDCTPDNSMNILNNVICDYPQLYSWIKIIQMSSNRGIAAVRREGIIAANGEYLAYCDSDDWVDKDMYRLLYEKAKTENLDMVWCDFYSTDGKNNCYISQNCSHNKATLVESYLAGLKTKMMASVWNRIYRRKLHDGEFIYPVGDMTEDFVITIQIILKSTKIGHLESALYYYFCNNNSIMHISNSEKVLKNFNDAVANTDIIIPEIKKYFVGYNLDDAIVAKKLSCKEILHPVLDQAEYRKLYKDTYSEVNNRFLFNPLIRFNSKIRAFCIQYNLYMIYKILIKIAKFHKND